MRGDIQEEKLALEIKDVKIKQLEEKNAELVENLALRYNTNTEKEQMDVDVEEKIMKQITMEKKNKEESIRKNQDPNLRELPMAVKPFVEEASKEFVVKGDGPCLLRTTAAHVYGDEAEWPQIARDLNTHQADYRDIYVETRRGRPR